MTVKIAFSGPVSLAILVAPAIAQAGTCEETFAKNGNAVTGLRFTAMTAVPDMPIDVAINQLRGIVAKRGYDIIASEPRAGALLIEQPLTSKSRSFPIEINATVGNGVGTVQMVAKLPAAMGAPTEGVKKEMCGVLAELKGGKEGRLAARAGSGAATVQAPPVQMSALGFSQQFSKDLERNELTVTPRYANKRYTLSGSVERVSRDGQDYRVWFDILQPYEMAIRLPNVADFNVDVGCALAPGQSVFALTLKPRKSIKLIGTYDAHDAIRKVVWLKDCAPVN